MPKPTLAVVSPDPVNLAQAMAIAHQLHLPYFEPGHLYDFLLLVTPEYIGIQPCQPQTKPLYVDFLSGKLQYRQNQASLRKETLARAMGMKPKDSPRIIDATTGLARDSFILASLGFEVTMLERSPILHLLVEDGIRRAAADPTTTAIVQKLQLVHADAITWLQQQPLTPHIIYLDPMFPERRKSAQVKKEMSILQGLLGEEKDSDQLLITALTCATQRVVVKRPRIAPPLASRAPTFQLIGKNSRFDIYIIRKP